ncbi:MAG: hypothetical protein KGH49_03935 [Candidatus Micrarchaeota archaeon]|nr:hypothetical protein [Candidatus Micrarchaeota archaeon]
MRLRRLLWILASVLVIAYILFNLFSANRPAQQASNLTTTIYSAQNATTTVVPYTQNLGNGEWVYVDSQGHKHYYVNLNESLGINDSANAAK